MSTYDPLNLSGIQYSDPGSITAHALGGETVRNADGILYTRVAKADGGYDYYSLAGDDYNDVRSVSESDAYGQSPVTKDDGYAPSSNYTGSSSSSSQNIAGERAYYDDQISALDRLLGIVGGQRQSGLNNLDNQQKTIMQGYDEQGLQNTQGKERGLGQVDRFANDSFNSLSRILQGANASGSGVAKQLIPYLISKGAGERRQGVFETTGQNARAIDQARNETNSEFGAKKNDFLSSLLMKENDILGQKSGLQVQKSIANGSGYEAAKAAAAGTNATMDGRMAELNGLFGQFTPVTKAPALSEYTVDPNKINTNNGMPQESSFYLNQLLNKRKQENQVA